MAVSETKLYDWESAESDDGHVDVTVTWLIITSSITDGPETVRLSASLPAAGDAYLIGADSTAYFYARRAKKAKRASSNPADKRRWYVNQVFSTRPLTRFGATGPIANPLLEPPIIRGTALKYMRRFTVDRFGNPLLSSSGERYTGPEVEDDDNNISLSITQNLASANLPLLRSVLRFTPWNNGVLWGLPTRTVKFADYDVEKLYVGDGTPYVRQSTKFEIGGDYIRKVLDEGTLEFIGTNPNNPTHYARIKDGRGENVKKLPLDGSGNALTDITSPVYHDFELKGDSNLLLLGIPATL